MTMYAQNDPQELDLERLVERVWQDFNQQIPQPEVRLIIASVAAQYQNVPVKKYISIFIQRESRDILQAALAEFL